MFFRCPVPSGSMTSSLLLLPNRPLYAVDLQLLIDLRNEHGIDATSSVNFCYIFLLMPSFFHTASKRLEGMLRCGHLCCRSYCFTNPKCCSWKQLLILNFCQRIVWKLFFDKSLKSITSKHTANVNELSTYALPGSFQFRICIV